MAARPLVLDAITAASFRNLSRVSLAFGPSARVVVVSGENGQGKTALLEAVYLASTSKSFRTSQLGELVQHGQPEAFVRATFSEDAEAGSAREQVVSLRGARRFVKIDAKRPPSLAAFATRSPVVCFHAGELELSQGPAASRRLLLDRVGMFLDPSLLDHAARYKDAQRARQRALEERGTGADDVPPFEALMAEHGAALTRCRARAVEALRPELQRAFRDIGQLSVSLEVDYRASAPSSTEAYASQLVARREKDRHRGLATLGPHRDDLALRLGDHPAREVASQGQHRAITLALKLAELAAVASARGVYPLLLLDDVSSELDEKRTAALFSAIRGHQGRVLLTTTRPGLIPPLEGRVDVTVREGAAILSLFPQSSCLRTAPVAGTTP